MNPVVRFAPSPTGKLHIGNIRTALYNWFFAKKYKGRFILRLDDTDKVRSTHEFSESILEDLQWLGIIPDSIEKQSERVSVYDGVIDRLKSHGWLYACYESPDEIECLRNRLIARGLPPIYDRSSLKISNEDHANLLAQGKESHWRFLLPNFEVSPFEPKRTEIYWNDLIRGPQRIDLASISDPILVRCDGTYLYTLPSVVDDIDMGLTHIIRGRDHVTNTAAQIALFNVLDANIPAFGHHNLLVDSSGEGFSKRKGALSIQTLRKNGYEPMAVSSLACLIGTSQSVHVYENLSQLSDVFDPQKISCSDAKLDIFDLGKLSQKILSRLSYADVRSRLVASHSDLGESFWNSVRPNLKIFSDVIQWRDVVNGNFIPRIFSNDEIEFLKFSAFLLSDEVWDSYVWKRWTDLLKIRTGRKGRSLFMPLRQAITGQDSGPEMASLLLLIGKDRTIRRLLLL
ncbi:glutamate--tRNA ligase [Candidatus Endowatersipora endosymbiont of Watersipora subatra]|uniref:glutamate--tRNA ligase n=1 Tax=Candidatus Endowatersipora endosymbiont of Watersipora subatra TaxID=3077946 RepID=UPI00312C86FA